jgi:hypothetical protein
MNTKQIAPIIAKLAPAIAAAGPPAIIIGGIAFFIWLLSDDDTEKPDNTPEKAAPLCPPLPVPRNSGGNSGQNPCVPSNSAEKIIVPPPRPSVPTNSVPTVPKNTVLPPSVIPALKTAPEIPLPVRKKFITLENMATVFHRGANALTRKAAVAALRKLGFGKTAAYDALSPDGRFSVWLQFAPDGIITWKS